MYISIYVYININTHTHTHIHMHLPFTFTYVVIISSKIPLNFPIHSAHTHTHVRKHYSALSSNCFKTFVSMKSFVFSLTNTRVRYMGRALSHHTKLRQIKIKPRGSCLVSFYFQRPCEFSFIQGCLLIYSS